MSPTVNITLDTARNACSSQRVVCPSATSAAAVHLCTHLNTVECAGEEVDAEDGNEHKATYLVGREGCLLVV